MSPFPFLQLTNHTSHINYTHQSTYNISLNAWRERKRERERLALAMAVHVTTESLRFAELKRTKPTFVHLLTLFFSFFPAFLFPPTCSKPNPSTLIKTTLQKPFNKLVIINNQLQHKSYTAYLIFPTFFPF